MDAARENRGGPVVEWGYRGPGGPEHWASLSRDFETCGKGRQQSPIDITGYRTQPEETGTIGFSYVTGTKRIRNDGLLVHIDFPAGNTFCVNEHSYQLTSAHSHCPSEHHVDGVNYAAELHLVHADDGGNLAVVGQLFELGPASSLIQAVLDSVPPVNQEAMNPPGIGAHNFLPRHHAHFQYDGSKTTPPCDEPVAWYVIRRPRTISASQVRSLLQLSGGPNNRPIQPIGDRSVTLTGGSN